jgi:hypothetical protein
MPAQLRDSRFHRVAGSCRLFEKHQKCGFVPAGNPWECCDKTGLSNRTILPTICQFRFGPFLQSNKVLAFEERF